MKSNDSFVHNLRSDFHMTQRTPTPVRFSDGLTGGKDHAEAWTITPHTDVESKSVPELQEALETADAQLEIANKGGPDLKFVQTWLVHERRLISAELERRRSVLNGPKDIELQDIPFLEAAWVGPFALWRDVVAPCTEAALENLWAAFLLATGLTLGRNVWKNHPRPLYPNFYVMLIGQTGDARKSTVLWFTEQLLRHVGEDDVKILPGIVSSEGIFEALAPEDKKALAYADEFRSLLSVARRSGTQDIFPKLSSLYYCPDRAEVGRRERKTEVLRPFFSLITATPLEYVEDLVGNREVTGGILNRFLIFSGKEVGPNHDPPSPTSAQWEDIAGPLRTIRNQFASRPHPMEFDPTAKAMWKEFYDALWITRKKWDAKAANLTARTFEHILKIATVLSALSDDRMITEKSLATAILIGEWLQKNSLRLFGNVGLDQFGRSESAVLEILKRRVKMFRRELQQAAFKKGINGEVFGRILKSLANNGQVSLSEMLSPSGQLRPTVEYVEETTVTAGTGNTLSQ
jgi:hypothetical protein